MPPGVCYVCVCVGLARLVFYGRENTPDCVYMCGTCCLCFCELWIVLLVRNAIFKLVFLNRFVQTLEKTQISLQTSQHHHAVLAYYIKLVYQASCQNLKMAAIGRKVQFFPLLIYTIN